MRRAGARRAAQGLHSAPSVFKSAPSGRCWCRGRGTPALRRRPPAWTACRALLGLGTLDARAPPAQAAWLRTTLKPLLPCRAAPAAPWPAADPRSPPGSGNAARPAASARDGRDAQQLCGWVLAGRAGAAICQAYAHWSPSSKERWRGLPQPHAGSCCGCVAFCPCGLQRESTGSVT